MIKPFAVAPAALTAALAAVGVAAPVAGSKTDTLSYYQVEGPTHFYNAQGRRINLDPPATLPTAGDRLDETDTDYAGTFKKHAKAWTSTDHLSCTFTSPSTGICNLPDRGRWLAASVQQLHGCIPGQHLRREAERGHRQVQGRARHAEDRRSAQRE